MLAVAKHHVNATLKHVEKNIGNQRRAMALPGLQRTNSDSSSVLDHVTANLRIADIQNPFYKLAWDSHLSL